MEPKNKKELIDKIAEAASEYSYEERDENFCIDVRIVCEDGWIGAQELDNN